jgi:septal ring factor EnvC (AmiA/AmiB activator)
MSGIAQDIRARPDAHPLRTRGFRIAVARVAVLAAVLGAATVGAQQPTSPGSAEPTSPPVATPPQSNGVAPTPEARLRADRAELDRIRGERTQLEQRMADLRSSVHDLSDEVENLDRQADATARVVRTLDRQLSAITTEVHDATGNLVRAQDELVIKRAMLRHRLVDIYKRGPLYTTQALLTAESFGALVARYK